MDINERFTFLKIHSNYKKLFLSNAVITQPQIDTVVQVLTKFVTKLKIGP